VSARRGVTLVELIAVMAILALTTTLSSVALRRLDAPRTPDTDEALRALRRQALAAGRPVTSIVRREGTAHLVTVLADGRIIADGALHVDPATGIVDGTSP
jgi:prepilin-type N-terminal cleavage/methylation domain-containing protein